MLLTELIISGKLGTSKNGSKIPLKAWAITMRIKLLGKPKMTEGPYIKFTKKAINTAKIISNLFSIVAGMNYTSQHTGT